MKKERNGKSRIFISDEDKLIEGGKSKVDNGVTTHAKSSSLASGIQKASFQLPRVKKKKKRSFNSKERRSNWSRKWKGDSKEKYRMSHERNIGCERSRS